MIDFSVLEITTEEIKTSLGKMVSVETLICEVTVGGETKRLNFNWINYRSLYCSKADLVYVSIPQGGTRRAFGSSDNIYWNKLRKADLYIEKVNGDFNLIKEYQVLDGEARIVSWCDSKTKILPHEEAMDAIIPSPIRSSMK